MIRDNPNHTPIHEVGTNNILCPRCKNSYLIGCEYVIEGKVVDKAHAVGCTNEDCTFWATGECGGLGSAALDERLIHLGY